MKSYFTIWLILSVFLCGGSLLYGQGSRVMPVEPKYTQAELDQMKAERQRRDEENRRKTEALEKASAQRYKHIQDSMRIEQDKRDKNKPKEYHYDLSGSSGSGSTTNSSSKNKNNYGSQSNANSYANDLINSQRQQQQNYNNAVDAIKGIFEKPPGYYQKLNREADERYKRQQEALKEREREKKREEEKEEEEWNRMIEKARVENERSEAAEKTKMDINAKSRQQTFQSFPFTSSLLSSSNKMEGSCYCFAYSYSRDHMAVKGLNVFVTNAFRIDKHADGTWPFTDIIKTEIAKILPFSITVHGYYPSMDEAISARQNFVSRLKQADVNIYSKNYAGKLSEAYNIPLANKYWGAVLPEEKANSLKTTNSTLPVLPTSKNFYEVAEKNFVLQDYNEALKALDELDNMLGKICERSLYLRVLTLDKIVTARDKPYADLKLLLQLQRYYLHYIHFFQGKTDGDKYKDIYSIYENYLNDGITIDIVNKAIDKDVDACYLLGVRSYQIGDYESSVKYFRVGEAQNHLRSLVKMALFYVNGVSDGQTILLQKNENKAIELFKYAASMNDWEAKAFLANYYYDKKLAKECAEYAIEMSKKAQSENDVFDIGNFFTASVLYNNKLGIECNYERALALYNKVNSYALYYSYTNDPIQRIKQYLNSMRFAAERCDNNDYPSAISNYELAYKQIKDNRINSLIASCYIKIGDKYMNQNRANLAIDNYKFAIRYLSDDDILVNRLIMSKLDEAYYANKEETRYLSMFPEGSHFLDVCVNFENKFMSNFYFCINPKNNCVENGLFWALRYLLLFPKGMDYKKIAHDYKKLLQMPASSVKIGISFHKSTANDISRNKYVIDEVFSGRPAAKAKMPASSGSDIYFISHVDGIPVDKLTDEQFIQLCVGPNNVKSIFLVGHICNSQIKRDSFYEVTR